MGARRGEHRAGVTHRIRRHALHRLDQRGAGSAGRSHRGAPMVRRRQRLGGRPYRDRRRDRGRHLAGRTVHHGRPRHRDVGSWCFMPARRWPAGRSSPTAAPSFVTNRGAVWAVDLRPSAGRSVGSPTWPSSTFSPGGCAPSPHGKPEPCGSVRHGGKVKYSPAYAGGNLFVVNEAGQVTALADADGSTRWTTQLDGEVVAEPVIAGDTLVLGTADGVLHGLDTGDGSLRWTHDTGRYPLSAAPSVSGGTLFLPTTDGKLTAWAGR